MIIFNLISQPNTRIIFELSVGFRTAYVVKACTLGSAKFVLTNTISVSNDRAVSSDKYVSKLYSSGWLQSVADNLTCAANVAKCVHCEGTQGMRIVLSLTRTALSCFVQAGRLFLV